MIIRVSTKHTNKEWGQKYDQNHSPENVLLGYKGEGLDHWVIIHEGNKEFWDSSVSNYGFNSVNLPYQYGSENRRWVLPKGTVATFTQDEIDLLKH